MDPELLRAAADAIRSAEALVVCAGAGMGVDSGLPDFRGDAGFWKAYPPYRHLGVSFIDMANPAWFRREPDFAWGFYGHRRNLYRETVPHEGFHILRRWADARPGGAFVFTSNVDGQFQRAGFPEERVVECHGAIEWNQCYRDCGAGIFPAGPERLEVDLETMRVPADTLPACPACGGLARPNILMFGDWAWDPARDTEQTRNLQVWLEESAGLERVVVECGAGGAIPTVRSFAERLVGSGQAARLVRVNPREPEVPLGHIGIAAGAQATLTAIDALLAE